MSPSCCSYLQVKRRKKQQKIAGFSSLCHRFTSCSSSQLSLQCLSANLTQSNVFHKNPQTSLKNLLLLSVRKVREQRRGTLNKQRSGHVGTLSSASLNPLDSSLGGLVEQSADSSPGNSESCRACWPERARSQDRSAMKKPSSRWLQP